MERSEARMISIARDRPVEMFQPASHPGLLSPACHRVVVEERRSGLNEGYRVVEILVSVTVRRVWDGEATAEMPKDDGRDEHNPRLFCRICGRPLNSEEEVLSWRCLDHLTSS